METGKVKFYNREKRYGFVTGDNGTDYFFHESMLVDGQQVRDEDRVNSTQLMEIEVNKLPIYPV